MSFFVKRLVNIDKLCIVDYNRIKDIINICHCTSLTTDMESYVELDAHPECIDRIESDVIIYLNNCEVI